MKVYIFQDGSLASQLLQAELRERNLDLDIKVVDSEDVIDWFTKIEPNQKVYLHFCYEDYIKDNEKLRRELAKLEHLGFRNLIVREYEGLDKKTMEQRCKDRGFKTVKIYDKTLLNKDEVQKEVDLNLSNKEVADKVQDIYKPYFEVKGNKDENDKPRKKRMFKL